MSFNIAIFLHKFMGEAYCFLGGSPYDFLYRFIPYGSLEHGFGAVLKYDIWWNVYSWLSYYILNWGA